MNANASASSPIGAALIFPPFSSSNLRHSLQTKSAYSFPNILNSIRHSNVNWEFWRKIKRPPYGAASHFRWQIALTKGRTRGPIAERKNSMFSAATCDSFCGSENKYARISIDGARRHARIDVVNASGTADNDCGKNVGRDSQAATEWRNADKVMKPCRGGFSEIMKASHAEETEGNWRVASEFKFEL